MADQEQSFIRNWEDSSWLMKWYMKTTHFPFLRSLQGGSRMHFLSIVRRHPVPFAASDVLEFSTGDPKDLVVFLFFSASYLLLCGATCPFCVCTCL
jgi:hypothetical protein